MIRFYRVHAPWGVWPTLIRMGPIVGLKTQKNHGGIKPLNLSGLEMRRLGSSDGPRILYRGGVHLDLSNPGCLILRWAPQWAAHQGAHERFVHTACTWSLRSLSLSIYVWEWTCVNKHSYNLFMMQCAFAFSKFISIWCKWVLKACRENTIHTWTHF